MSRLFFFSVFLLLTSCTTILPTQVKIPPTDTNTLAPPTATSAPPTSTPLPPTLTNTPAPPTATREIVQTLTGNDGMTLLYVSAGEFTMGSDTSYKSDERPEHQVSLDAFWIDQTEVTNAMYAKCVADGTCKEPDDKSSYSHPSYYNNPEFDLYPVIYVDWNMAKTYCEWADRRLPTEAEWEKAARGENGRIYPWGDESPNANLLNYNSNAGDTTEVGNYLNGKSIYGALDMAGNVWEWVNDWYDVYPGGDANISNDFGQKYRVLRGGAWDSYDDRVRSAQRVRDDPTNSYYFLGFRCAMSATP